MQLTFNFGCLWGLMLRLLVMNKDKINIFLNKLFLFDVLFFPLISAVRSSLSAPLILMHGLPIFAKKIYSAECALIAVFMLLTVISVLLSSLSQFTESFFFINFVQLSLLFLFFFYFVAFVRFFSSHYCFAMKSLYWFYFFNFALALIYIIDFRYFFELRSFWSLTIVDVGMELSSLVRFTSIFSDPNNAAVIIVAIYSMLSIYSKQSRVLFLLNTLICFFIVVTTMSVTGFIVFVFAFSFILLCRLQLAFSLGFNEIMSSMFLYIIFILVMSGVFNIFHAHFSNADVLSFSFGRLESGSADSRLSKFVYVTKFDFYDYLLIGYGGTILHEGLVFKPHIGHLHFILNYGVFSYLIFLYVVFRIRSIKYLKYYIPIAVVFLGFSVNTCFIEYRFTVVFAVLLAMYVVKIKKMNEGHE